MFCIIVFSILNISIEKNKSKFFFRSGVFRLFLKLPPTVTRKLVADFSGWNGENHGGPVQTGLLFFSYG